MISMIYNYCLYLTIIIIITLIKLVICFMYIQVKKLRIISNKDNVYLLIKEVKQDLIKDFNIFSPKDIQEIIRDIIQIYINNTCDFAEDYENNQKIYYNDIDIFIITKKMQIMKDIKNKLLLNYNNDFNEKFELSILTIP